VNRRRLVSVLAAGVLLGAASVPATAAWTGPKEIASANGLSLLGLEIAINDHGDGIGVWTQRERGGHAIRYIERRRDGSWTASRVLAFDPDFLLTSPQVVVDGEGRMTATWRLQTSTMNPVTYLQGATRERGAGWTRPATLSTKFVAWLESSLTVTGSGRVVVAWWGTTNVNNVTAAFGSTRRDPGGAWTAVPPVAPKSGSPLGFGAFPRLTPQDDGSVVQSWMRFSGKRGDAVRTMTATLRANAARWTRPVQSYPTQTAGQSLTIGKTGAAVILHRTHPHMVRGVAGPSSISVTSRAKNGTWRAKTPLGVVGPGDDPRMAVGGGGTGLVTFSRTLKNFGASSLEAVVVDPDGRVAAPTVLAQREAIPSLMKRTPVNEREVRPWNESLAVDASGRALVAWSVSAYRDTAPFVGVAGIAVAERGPGAAWSPATTLVDFDAPLVGVAPHVITFGEDSALVLWTTQTEGGSAVFVSERR
jgi:hypothetical protein